MLHNLYPDILLQIFNNLSLNDLNNLKQTNKKLNNTINILYDQIYPIGTYNIDISDISDIIKKCPNLNLSI